jgi:hypothetical protein
VNSAPKSNFYLYCNAYSKDVFSGPRVLELRLKKLPTFIDRYDAVLGSAELERIMPYELSSSPKSPSLLNANNNYRH